jgi:hypothetical protein
MHDARLDREAASHGRRHWGESALVCPFYLARSRLPTLREGKRTLPNLPVRCQSSFLGTMTAGSRAQRDARDAGARRAKTTLLARGRVALATRTKAELARSGDGGATGTERASREQECIPSRGELTRSDETPHPMTATTAQECRVDGRWSMVDGRWA